MIDNRGNKKKKLQEEIFHKVHVNCLITLFATLSRNAYKIRI